MGIFDFAADAIDTVVELFDNDAVSTIAGAAGSVAGKFLEANEKQGLMAKPKSARLSENSGRYDPGRTYIAPEAEAEDITEQWMLMFANAARTADDE